nr:bifunctional NUDIX hydrolase/histidine phosphatase family protein [uncultured Corynebacterium sp.]
MISHSGIGDLSTSVASRNPGGGSETVVSRIGSSPADEFVNPVFAAGAVMWRRLTVADPVAPETAAEDAVEIAVIHRPRYDDWSLPKGKVDKGEGIVQTAVRELAEETGYASTLGWLLGYVHYPVGGSTKVVWYWTAEVTDHSEPTPEDTDEVGELRWVSPGEAARLCTYDTDREVITAACERLSLGVSRRVLYVRHAKAADRRGWQGDDQLRPLTRKGHRQAEALIGVARGYGVRSLSSADLDRCTDTLGPTAEALGLETVVDHALGDAALDNGPRTVMDALVRASTAPVSEICSQGVVIPAVVTALAADTGTELEDVRSKKGSVWVLHFSAAEKLLGADYLASPLPVR